ncbi:MAG TPA: hypothetical protein DDW52_11565 [Planctomycetaceae bacterium]|nr:hypothetical protein [Planctomycetaceae bacterium]
MTAGQSEILATILVVRAASYKQQVQLAGCSSTPPLVELSAVDPGFRTLSYFHHVSQVPVVDRCQAAPESGNHFKNA